MNETSRTYATEGSIHLYSSEPVVLTPAELYQAKSNSELQALTENCNVYIIATRRRILINPDDFRLEGGKLSGQFIVQRPSGIEKIPFSWQVPKPIVAFPDLDIGVVFSGTHICISAGGLSSIVASHVLVASAESNISQYDKDLTVLYVGQGIGRSKKRSAIDRLLNHSTMQRILAEWVTYYPDSEILLLLYRFEHGRSYLSTGGDFNAEPLSAIAEERAHMERMGDVRLSRHDKVALAEAGLIKYFQPWFNVQIKGSDFSARKKLKVLEHLLQKDMTGLIVEICTSNLRSRLQTEQAQPMNLHDLYDPDVLSGSRLTSTADKLKWAQELHLIAHSHFATFPLTTPEQRDTFMHGNIWFGSDERVNFMQRS
jgi:hypothetical protein